MASTSARVTAVTSPRRIERYGARHASDPSGALSCFLAPCLFPVFLARSAAARAIACSLATMAFARMSSILSRLPSVTGTRISCPS